MRQITITLDIPDGVEVRVNGGPAGDSRPTPLPSPTRVQAQPTARPVLMRANGASTGPSSVCPRHHVPWRFVPAGISKRSGRAYSEFWTCPEPGCDERPR
jgi:hypothetical protein